MSGSELARTGSRDAATGWFLTRTGCELTRTGCEFIVHSSLTVGSSRNNPATPLNELSDQRRRAAYL